jgi:hypothetical protein
MNSLEQLFSESLEHTKGIQQLYTTQEKLIINSLKTHLAKLESSFQKENSMSVLTDVVGVIFSQKNPTTTSKLSEKQKILLQQIDRVTACIDKVSKLNYLQKNDILDTLYSAGIKQSMDKIIIYVKSAYKIKN